MTNDKRVEEIRAKYERVKGDHPHSSLCADMGFLLSELDRAVKVAEAARRLRLPIDTILWSALKTVLIDYEAASAATKEDKSK